jgi:hypothetical protein
VAAELAASSGVPSVGGRAPFCVSGHFGHREQGAHSAVRLHLEVSQADRTLLSLDEDALAPRDVPTWLEGAANRVLALAVARHEEPISGAHREARDLVRRADRFARLGFWSEAAALLEARLLLGDGGPDLRLRLAQVYLELFLQGYNWDDDPSFVGANRTALHMYLAGLHHLEEHLSRAERPTRSVDFVRHYYDALDDVCRYVRARGPKTASNVLREISRERHDLLVRAVLTNDRFHSPRDSVLGFGICLDLADVMGEYSEEEQLGARFGLMIVALSNRPLKNHTFQLDILHRRILGQSESRRMDDAWSRGSPGGRVSRLLH